MGESMFSLQKKEEDGTIEIQSYSANNFQTASPFIPLWWDGKEKYRAEKPKDVLHEPYTDMEITQADIALHSFQLTKSQRLPKVIIDECKINSDIWWPDSPRRSNKQNQGDEEQLDHSFNEQKAKNAKEYPDHIIDTHTAINNETFAKIADTYKVEVKNLCRWNAHLANKLTSKSKCKEGCKVMYLIPKTKPRVIED